MENRLCDINAHRCNLPAPRADSSRAGFPPPRVKPTRWESARGAGKASAAEIISQTAALMHGAETRMGADAGYVGATKRDEVQQKLQGMPHAVRRHIAKRRTPIRKMAEGWQKDLALSHEKLKARLRAKVEHPFHIIKKIFKHKKTRSPAHAAVCAE